MRRQYWADFLPDHMLPGTAELACHLLLGDNDDDGSGELLLKVIEETRCHRSTEDSQLLAPPCRRDHQMIARRGGSL